METQLITPKNLEMWKNYTFPINTKEYYTISIRRIENVYEYIERYKTTNILKHRVYTKSKRKLNQIIKKRLWTN